jgi:hypothetical protein
MLNDIQWGKAVLTSSYTLSTFNPYVEGAQRGTMLVCARMSSALQWHNRLCRD